MSAKPRIVYPDADQPADAPFHAPLTRLDGIAEVVVHEGRPEDFEQYIERVRDADAIILGWDLPGPVMEQAHKLKMVAFTGIGVARFVDLEQARTRNIVVSNTPGYADITVAEHAMALLLAVTRHIVPLHNQLRAGKWDQSRDAVELHGRSVGILGFGGIGQAFARLCLGFGMRVKAWNRTRRPEFSDFPAVEFCDLNEIYACDVVSLHLAANDETIGMVGNEAFSLMQRGSILVNTARAELVDEAALLEALGSGRLAGAGLDVFHNEPLPADHPLLAMENVVLSPHVGFNTPEATGRIMDIAVDNLVAFYNGTPINVVS